MIFYLKLMLALKSKLFLNISPFDPLDVEYPPKAFYLFVYPLRLATNKSNLDFRIKNSVAFDLLGSKSLFIRILRNDFFI